jgi:tripartite ATP-independent transporter DctM subunit
MSPIAIGIASLIVLLGLLAVRVPIGFAMVAVSTVGITLVRGWDVAAGALQSEPFDFASKWSFSAIPMFILMGAVVHNSGIAHNLFRAARVWLGRVPGGLAVSANLACAGFAAASGSSLATAAAMSRIAIPEMKEAGYDMRLASGVVASAGTLGVMIPPSITFLIYAIFAEVSVEKLFIAGILPGLLTALIYTIMIDGLCIFVPRFAPRSTERYSLATKFLALRDVWPLAVFIIVIIGGMYGGVFTATEAGAFGAFVAFVIAAVHGRLNWTLVCNSVLETVITTASIFWVAIGAMLLTRLLAITGTGAFLTSAIGSWAFDPLMLVLACSIIYLILGMFLDPLGVLLISLPVVLPMIKNVHADLIWFGVLVVKFVEIGLLTPPVGMNVYVINSTNRDIKLHTIFQGAALFLACEVVIVALLIGFPSISTFLPGLMD